MFIETLVECRRVNVHVRMFLGEFLDSLGCRHEAHHGDMCAAGLLDARDCVAGGTARREHRVDQNDLTVLDIRGHLEVIVMRFMRVGIAVHTDVADAGDRHKTHQTVYHPQPCTQDRNDCQFLPGDTLQRRTADRGLHLHIFER